MFYLQEDYITKYLCVKYVDSFCYSILYLKNMFSSFKLNNNR